MSISNHSRNKKALAKAVQRKEKARRLRFERSHRKQPLSTAQFAKEFVSEALDLLKLKASICFSRSLSSDCSSELCFHSCSQGN